MNDTSVVPVAAPSAAERFKSFAIVVPFVASSIAIIYDVGFFVGIDISFFTFFSITEHFVFALQAIPFALPVAAVLFSWVFSAWLGKVSSDIRFERLLTIGEPKLILNELRKSIRQGKIILYILTPFMLLLAGFSLYTHRYTQAFVALIPIVATATPSTFINRVGTLRFLAVASTVVIAVTSFLVGLDRANSILTSTAPVETVSHSDKSFEGRIIRAGDKGVLFFSTNDRKVRFFRWDTIKQIETL